MNPISWMRRIIHTRQAYRAVFMPDDKNIGPSAEIVLSDLRGFCRATSTPAVASSDGKIDPVATGILIGRLEVWHRITSNLHLSDAALYKMVEKQQQLQDGTE